MSYFQNVENVVGATELIKDETKITLKTAIKAKNFNKKFERFLLGKNGKKLTCFNFVVGKGLRWLRWLKKP